jgi:pimeloyl-[acyl-carrier protein] methyl ester esterase
MKIVLLPGMDGTGELFEPFIRALPPHWSAMPVAYPTHEAWGYDELFQFVQGQLPKHEDFVLLGESFSGPLALKIAAHPPKQMRALLLVCTFAKHPRPALKFLSSLASLASLFRPPKSLIAAVLTNGATQTDVAGAVQQAVGKVSAQALKARLHTLNRLDDFLGHEPVTLPTLYLQAAQDRVVPSACLQLLKEYLPQMQSVSLEGPHCLLQVNPNGCVKAIEQFLRAQISAE